MCREHIKRKVWGKEDLYKDRFVEEKARKRQDINKNIYANLKIWNEGSIFALVISWLICDND